MEGEKLVEEIAMVVGEGIAKITVGILVCKGDVKPGRCPAIEEASDTYQRLVYCGAELSCDLWVI
jgi:hypothetical protein